MRDRRLVFRHVLLTFLCFSDKQTEDRPESPAAASKVELSLQEVPWQEVEKSIEGSTAMAQGILGCHSILAVSSLCIRVLILRCRVLCLDRFLLTGSG